MRTLYHHWLNPGCRVVRLALGEKQLDHDLQLEKAWERRTEFLRLNPAGVLPVLVEADDTVVAGHRTVLEYLEEAYPEHPLLPRRPGDRAEVRRLIDWFDHKFSDEVTRNLVGEKVDKRLAGLGQPTSAAIRAGLANINYHLEYVAFLTERRKWLAGDQLSLADLAAAAHYSAIDYLGDVPWVRHPVAKEWYVRIKSRPSFRPMLKDRIIGIAPAAHYGDLDF